MYLVTFIKIFFFIQRMGFLDYMLYDSCEQVDIGEDFDIQPSND